MQQGKEGSLLTQPSEAKPQTNPHTHNPSQLIKNSAQDKLHHPESEYRNQFLTPLQNARPNRTPMKGHGAKDKVNRSNRSKTEPRQQPAKLCRKRELLLPEIKAGGDSVGVGAGVERDGKLVKLRELYQKKSKLFRKLQFVNRKLIKAKMDISFPQEPPLPINSTLHPQHPPPPPLGKPHSRSHGSSRNNHYFLDFRRTKHPSPESISSLDKNRQVISFIQKMHEQSVQRDLNRYERSQKLVANQLSDVCLECSRSKCQADALGRILKESRFHA